MKVKKVQTNQKSIHIVILIIQKDGVKGIYVTPDSAKGKIFEELIQFINETELNAMVIDVKDDEGNITMDFKSDNKLISSNTVNRVDVKSHKSNGKTIFIQLHVLLHLKILDCLKKT